MAKRTPQQEMEYQMQKLKAMGVTISVQPARSRPNLPADHPFAIIADAAKAVGVYEETSNS